MTRVNMGNNEIAHEVNPANGEVTLYLRNHRGGPVITGKNLTEAMLRWQEAFALYRIIVDFPLTWGIADA